MNKIEELKTTQNKVKVILENDELARNSDDYLYCMLCEMIDENSVNLPFWKVMLNRKEYKFPSFKSVERARRKLQRSHPEFAGVKDVEAQRELNEEEYKEYARGIV